MTIGELIHELQKFPPELYITINDYDYCYDIEPQDICWDITMEEYKDGYADTPYIYLEKRN